MRKTTRVLICNIIFVILLILLFQQTKSVGAAGATFVVNSTGDEHDSNEFDMECKTLSNTCTLRAAIEQANYDAGSADTITFNIPTSLAIDTIITVGSPLPDIVFSTIIQGPNISNGKGIVINGGGVWGNGLTIIGNGVTIRNLKIRNFGTQGILIDDADIITIEDCVIGSTAGSSLAPGNVFRGMAIENANNVNILNNIISGNGGEAGSGEQGIRIVGGGSHIIQGNLIGVDQTGTIARPNLGVGISASDSSNNLIGGSLAIQHNLISGNGGTGIQISGGTGNKVIGNFIGTDITGNIAIPNGGDGIQLLSSTIDAEIGGDVPGEGNLISGNISAGIRDSGTSTQIQGNIIGLNITKTTPIPNANGIFHYSGTSATIGGTNPGEMNTIAGNTHDGIVVGPFANQKQIIGNAIYDNGGLGINLKEEITEDPSLVTENDDGDGDTGANNLQNHPIITGFSYAGGTSLTISGKLNSLPLATFIIHFYGNDSCDASGYGEGQYYLGKMNITTAANNEVNFTKTISTTTVYDCISATATDSDGNTSEFSTTMEGYFNYLPLVTYGN